MRRREFIAGSAATAVLPATSFGQQADTPVIGYLGYGIPDKAGDIIAEVQRGLAEVGYVDGKNLKIEYRWAEWRPERLEFLANDLAAHHPKLIIMFAMPPSIIEISKSTPLVVFSGIDPVRVGVVESLRRPGGNITGVAVLNSDLIAKRLEILRQVVPPAKTIILLSTSVSYANENEELKAAARVLELELRSVIVNEVADFEGAFARIASAKADAASRRSADQDYRSC
jgi:putative ABC transport system substrate-binding protein